MVYISGIIEWMDLWFFKAHVFLPIKKVLFFADGFIHLPLSVL